jgi:hypothetical protein
MEAGRRNLSSQGAAVTTHRDTSDKERSPAQAWEDRLRWGLPVCAAGCHGDSGGRGGASDGAALTVWLRRPHQMEARRKRRPNTLGWALAFVLAFVLASPMSADAKGSKASSGGQKAVHVKEYTKKDGTTVEAHERKAPQPRNEVERATGQPTARVSGRPIHIVTDPVTGRQRITNEPIAEAAPLSATPRAPLSTAVIPSAPRSSITARLSVATAASRKPVATKPASPTSEKSSAIARTANGRIQRSDAARHAFARQTGYPSGRHGYVIDHIKPLACGGADAPSNMQWQTVAEGKAKDRIERRGC